MRPEVGNGLSWLSHGYQYKVTGVPEKVSLDDILPMEPAPILLLLFASLLACCMASIQHVVVTWSKEGGAIDNFCSLDTFRQGISGRSQSYFREGSDRTEFDTSYPELINKFILRKRDGITRVEFKDIKPTISGGVYNYELTYSSNQFITSIENGCTQQ